MDKFNQLIQRHFKISLGFLALGFIFGIMYSISLLGMTIDSEMLQPQNLRSVHISLMLYGFITLMLSYLPFLLIYKEMGSCDEGIRFLNLYTIFWYIFLIFMTVSLLFGDTRGLAFYDFAYELNFLLAFAGMFYIIALYKFVKQYKIYPLWVKVCLRVVFIAPFALLILMNPDIGQVQSTISGPHGDNTLGMSLAIIPLYYLIIKLLSKEVFYPRWNIFWIIPSVFYFGSILYRTFYDALTYNQEWFLQYLTLLYVPLLYRWFKDAKLQGYAKNALFVSIVAFLFVDIEGNILFIPEIRWMFHRNDLIVAHAHVAMGLGVFFMVIAMFHNHIAILSKARFYKLYLVGLIGIFVVLSLSGLSQAGIVTIDIFDMWMLRTLFGIVVLISLICLIKYKTNLNGIEKYNFIGVVNDGIGGIILFLLASYLYPMFGFEFHSKYEYIVFSFVFTTGIIHLFALIYSQHRIILTNLTIIIRIIVSSVFFSLYSTGVIGTEALLICLFDLMFASYYLIFIYGKCSNNA